jgi:hypothetical protein
MTKDEAEPGGAAQSPAATLARQPKRHKPAPARIVAIALGVPLLLTLLFVILYATGVIRDERRADYCANYAPVSADLGLFDNFADDLAAGDPATIIASVSKLRLSLGSLGGQASTAVIQDRLHTMVTYLQRVELAARAHDDLALAELNDQITAFASDRHQFLNHSAEYCRYR